MILISDAVKRSLNTEQCPSKHKNDFLKCYLWRLVLTVCDAIPS